METPQAYLEQETILSAQYECVNGYDFYKFLFPDNENQGEWHNDFSHPNAIFLYQEAKDETAGRKVRRRVMLNDTWEHDYAEYVEGNPFALCSGLSYRRRENRINNAQKMNALIFDLDGVGKNELNALFKRSQGLAGEIWRLPHPTFVVMSGTGIHLYYVFETPIDLYPNIKVQLKAMKYELTFRLWHYGSTTTRKQVEYQSINQGFRMVGSINQKYGTVVKAYRVGGKVTIDDLNRCVKDPKNRVDLSKPFRPSKMTKEAAREAYPEWYQRVVVEKQKRPKKWDIKGKQGYALYEWWLKHIDDILGGHRYYFLMCMAIYACKCDVPYEKLREDMQTAFETLRGVPHENPLTENDIESALEAYDREYYNFTIADIEKLTNVRIERNRRNGRKQKDHLEEARAIRDVRMKRQGKNWWKGNGRPSLEQNVREYMQAHPDARKCDVARGTGVSKPTVYKYYDKIKQEMAMVEAVLTTPPQILIDAKEKDASKPE